MRARPVPSLVLPLISLLAIAGCAGLAGRDAETERKQARADDALCVKDGHRFPSDAYTSCRRKLADQRTKRSSAELALAPQQSGGRSADQAIAEVTPPFHRPIDPARFSCEKSGAEGDQVILCRER